MRFSTEQATPYQLPDKVEFGAHHFSIAQLPLQEKIEALAEPVLVLTSSGNNKGYEAKWAIREGELFLTSFAAKTEERSEWRDVGIGVIIDGAKLPLTAKWFSGRLQLPIGDYSYETNAWPVIVEIVVEKGKVSSISTALNSQEVHAWNGLRANEAVQDGKIRSKPDDDIGE